MAIGIPAISHTVQPHRTAVVDASNNYPHRELHIRSGVDVKCSDDTNESKMYSKFTILPFACAGDESVAGWCLSIEAVLENGVDADT